VLTKLLVELIHWIECKKKTIINSVSSKTRANNCYSEPALDIMFKKWFPLFEVPLSRTTLKIPISPTSQECQVVQQQEVSPKPVTKEQLLEKKRLTCSNTASPYPHISPIN
jgi:hypothetical protein